MYGLPETITFKQRNMTKSIAFLAAFFLINPNALCEIRPAPIEEKDLIGAWAGCAQGCTEFYRLELKADRSGFLVILEPDLKQTVYSISGWKIQSEQLRMMLRPHAGAEAIEVQSLRLGTRYFEIEIQASIVGWKRKVTLLNEKDWDERTRRAREASK